MATLYFAPAADGGNNANPGTYASPKETIAGAHTAAASGDTIVLKTSTSTYTFANQTFAKNLTIEGETTNPENHVLDGAAGSIRWIIGGYTIQCTALKFQNVIGTTTDKPVFDYVTTGSVLSMTNCCFSDDIYVQGGGISSLGGLFGCGGNMGVASVTLTNCLINDIKKTTGEGDTALFVMFRPSATSSFTVVGCTVYLKTAATNNMSAIFSLASFASPLFALTVKNTIIVNETGNTVNFDMQDTSMPLAYANSVTYSDLYLISNYPTGGDGLITSDPLFVDPDNDNFYLRPSSPCIGTGTLV